MDKNTDFRITFVVSEDEKKKIKSAADERGMTISAYIRWVLLYENNVKEN